MEFSDACREVCICVGSVPLFASQIAIVYNCIIGENMYFFVSGGLLRVY